MWPLIREGLDTVEVRPCSGKPGKGDVIMFHDGSRYVLHRIIEVRPDSFVTRGDNCSATENVPRSSVLGVMTALWRDERRILLNSTIYRAYTHAILNCQRTLLRASRLLRRLSR